MPRSPSSLKLCLLLAWSAPLYAQGARFTACEVPPTVAAAPVQLGALTAEVRDGVLQLSGDGLFGGADPRPAACTHPNGTGVVHAVAHSGFGQCVVAAERGFIDEVIMPHNTRKRVARAFAALRGKKLENPWKKHGNIPL